MLSLEQEFWTFSLDFDTLKLKQQNEKFSMDTKGKNIVYNANKKKYITSGDYYKLQM